MDKNSLGMLVAAALIYTISALLCAASSRAGTVGIASAVDVTIGASHAATFQSTKLNSQDHAGSSNAAGAAAGVSAASHSVFARDRLWTTSAARGPVASDLVALPPPVVAAPMALPEPGALLITLAGLAILAFTARRRQPL